MVSWDGYAKLAAVVWPFLVGATVRGGLLVLLAAAVLGLWSRASAAQRHLVLTVVCGSLVLLLALQVVVPTWHLRILPLATVSANDLVAPQSVIHTTNGKEAAIGGREVTISADRAAGRSLSKGFWIMLAVGGWGIGVLGVIAVLLINQRKMRQLVEAARPLTQPHMLAILAQAARSLQLDYQVPVREHASAIPMLCGTFRPVIVLPVSARTWGDSRLRNVLLHEMAHIKRRDSLTQMVADLAVALHWFNPLVWLVARALRTERERAGDDVVLAAGCSPRDYAMDLLDLTQTFKSLRGASIAAVAFAQPSQLQTRVQSIVDRARCRSLMSRRSAMAIWGAGLGVVYPLVGVTLQRNAQRGMLVRQLPQDIAVSACQNRVDVFAGMADSTHLFCRETSGSADMYAPRKEIHLIQENSPMNDHWKKTAHLMSAAAMLAGTPSASWAKSRMLDNPRKVKGDSFMTIPHIDSTDVTSVLAAHGDTIVVKTQLFNRYVERVQGTLANGSGFVVQTLTLTNFNLSKFATSAGISGSVVHLIVEDGVAKFTINNVWQSNRHVDLDLSKDQDIVLVTEAGKKYQ